MDYQLFRPTSWEKSWNDDVVRSRCGQPTVSLQPQFLSLSLSVSLSPRKKTHPRVDKGQVVAGRIHRRAILSFAQAAEGEEAALFSDGRQVVVEANVPELLHDLARLVARHAGDEAVLIENIRPGQTMRVQTCTTLCLFT